MFNINDKVKVFAGEHKDKKGTIINISYKLGEVPIVVLRLDDKSEIKVDIVDL